MIETLVHLCYKYECQAEESCLGKAEGMNIKVQCCGVVLLALLAMIYGRQRKLKLTASRVFLGCFYVSMCSLAMDILSLAAIAYREKLPLSLVEFICKTYIILLVLVILFAVVYVATSVSFHLPDYKNNVVAYIVFFIVDVILIYVLPISIHEKAEENLAWTDGSSTYVAYFGALVLIVINLVQLFLYKKYIYERQRRTVLIWMLMWIAAACIQIFNKELLVIGFACALGVTVVFFQFENPELNLDWHTGLFNYVAYTRYGEQLYSDGNKKFYVIAVLFENTTWQDEQNSSGSVEAQRTFDVLLEIQGASAFKITENEVLLLFTNGERAKAVWDRCVEWVSKEEPHTSQKRPSFYYVEDPRCVSSYSELLELIQYASLLKKDSIMDNAQTVGSGTVEQMLSERTMIQQILSALEEDRVVVYYQPIYSIEDKCFTSAEALVRIVDREGKIIPPGAFINIAENNGMIINIGRRVFEKVCQFFQTSRLEDYGMRYIEVNLSVVQCADEKLADTYIAVMNSMEMDPGRINLEITESASLRAKRILISNMERMIEYGIHFSLDDFGTGQSNLNYIVDMPVKIVKFDREMSQAYFANDKAKYVMDAAIHMIHGMGMRIVAEGIETEEQYKKMEEIQIDYIQGFYFSKPLPEQEFLDFLRRENSKVL